MSLSSCSGLGGKDEILLEEESIARSGSPVDKTLADFQHQESDITRGESGQLVGGKRSQFDGKRSVAFGGGVGTASYAKPVYNAPGWSGDTSRKRKTYAGPTDGSRHHTSSRFSGSTAAASGSRSRYAGASAATGNYRTSRATETAQASVSKPRDAKTHYRRNVYPQPTIFTQDEYTRMTIEQTRNILGRSD